MRKLFVAGNWKMNLDREQSLVLAGQLRSEAGGLEDITVAVCPPFVYLKGIADVLKDTGIGVGGQNMHTESSGAFTGEVSGGMLRDAGCEYVIIGHSERRHIFGESDEFIAEKVKKALSEGLKPIVCVGETLEQRKNEETQKTVSRQFESALQYVDKDDMAAVTIAYEPVWAIGTGRTATPQQADDVHALIRSLAGDFFDPEVAEGLIIQYGGSVKPENAADLLGKENVDGALVGGASLTAADFLQIIEAGRTNAKS